jgi:hypothetical protein
MNRVGQPEETLRKPTGRGQGWQLRTNGTKWSGQTEKLLLPISSPLSPEQVVSRRAVRQGEAAQMAPWAAKIGE